MAKETAWTRQLVLLLGIRLPSLLLLTGLLAVTMVRSQNLGTSDPCWYGDHAACQAGCSQYYNAGGSCQGYQCVCMPPTNFPGYPSPTGPIIGMGHPGFGSRMSEAAREVPCFSGNQRCAQFCMEHTGYSGVCHGQACKCMALNRR
ncbi:uncharacterized protein LOC142768478 [Rhipicephalus microplus]|uniref:uncharacterized protein LOC142768478 n=1 Tax=Rhipicephalus microplus TaxID=6941 RepID=UPI003F6A866C